MTDANILVASECVDELKILYSAICSLNGFMHSPMIFLIINSDLDQLCSYFFDRSLNTCPSTTHNAAKC